MPAPRPILPCPAFPDLDWWSTALPAEAGLQLYTGRSLGNTDHRNRYRILTANGPLLLSIPLTGGRRRAAALGDTRIDPTHAWQRQHWGALHSAYGRAPFFEHYGPELEAIIMGQYGSLLEFNLAGIRWLARTLRPGLQFDLTSDLPGGTHDITPSKKTGTHYYQVFGDRCGFVEGLSAIDLIMNEGPAAETFLR